MRLLLILIYFLNTTQAQAETLVLEGSVDGLSLGRSLFYWEDPSAEADIENVRELNPAVFTPSSGSAPNFGFSSSAFWGKFTLHNPGNDALTLFLEYRYSNVDILDFYYRDAQGVFQNKKSGDQRPSSLREIPSRLPVFGFVLPPGESTFYVRIQTEGASQLPLYVWTPELFHKRHVKESSFLAMLYGFLVVMVLYNSFLAISMRSRTHVVYVLFILNSLFHFMGMQGLFFLFVPDRFAPWMNNTGFMITAGGTVTLASLFSRSFLDLRVYSRGLYRLLSTVAILGVFVIAITPFSYGIGSRLSAVCGLLTPVAVLSASVYCCVRKFRPAYFFTFAWLACIIGYFIYVLSLGGYIPVNALSSWGPFLGVAFEVVLISLALGDKLLLRQQLAERQIRDLNDNLEKKVVEKTRDIHSILLNIKLGILSIVGQDLLIDREYSTSIESIFHEKDLAGKKALAILFRDADLPKDALAIMESALVASIGEHAIAMELNMDCLVRELRLIQNGKFRIIELDWNPIQSKDQTTEKILVTVRDVTEIHEYQQAMQVQRKELEYISELIHLAPNHADKFFANARSFIEQNRELIQNHDSTSESLEVLFVNMHTFKGLARSLGLKDLAALCHEIEQSLALLQKKPDDWNLANLMDDQIRLEKVLDIYEDLHEHKLNRRKNSTQDVPVARRDILAVIKSIEDLEKQTELQTIRTGLHNLRDLAIEHVSAKAKDLLDECMAPLPDLARELGKVSPRISLETPNVMFTQEAGDALRHAMIHILRNTLDHGLETATERKLAGKNEQGEIKIHMEDQGPYLQLTISDDGRGLALKSIEEMAIERGMIPEQHKLSHLEIGALIFASNFSTSKVVTDISGRGVGMDAVKRLLENLDGSVQVQIDSVTSGPLPEYAPFHLVLRIPEQHFHRMQLQRRA